MDSLAVTLIFYGASAAALLIGVVIGSHLRAPIRFRRNRRSRGAADYTPVASKLPVKPEDTEAAMRDRLAQRGLSAERIDAAVREINSEGAAMLGRIERPTR